jgi:hypothetical protein
MNPRCSQYSEFGLVKWGTGVPKKLVISDIVCVVIMGHIHAHVAKAMKHHVR